MDFIAEKQRILQEMSGLAADCSRTQKSLALLEKRLIDTKGVIERLKAEKQGLTGAADDALASDQNEFEKFKTALRKNNASIEANSEALKALAEKIVPAKQREVSDLRRKLTNAFFDAFKPVFAETQKLITVKLDEAVSIHDDFIETVYTALAESGIPDPVSYTNFISSQLEPQPSHPRIEGFNGAVVFAGMRKPAPLLSLPPQIEVFAQAKKPAAPVVETAPLEKLSLNQTDPEAPGIMVERPVAASAEVASAEQQIPEPVITEPSAESQAKQWAANTFGPAPATEDETPAVDTAPAASSTANKDEGA